MADAVLNLLGIARRAGCLSLGSHASEAALKTGRAKLLLLASDLSGRSRRTLSGMGEARVIPWRALPCDIAALSQAVGTGAGCLTVNDDGFTKKILALLSKEECSI